jgi:hypothetical protein
MVAAVALLLVVAVTVAVLGPVAGKQAMSVADTHSGGGRVGSPAPAGTRRGPSPADAAGTTPSLASVPQNTTPGVQVRCRYRAYPDHAVVPDPACTPGALDAAAVADPGRTMCAAGWSRRARPSESYTEPLKIRGMVAYGSVGPPSAYEEDHLVAIEDGGSPRSRKNLWPEYLYGAGGAVEKDKAEARVHDLICAGRLSVRQGAAALEGDWKRAVAGG